MCRQPHTWERTDERVGSPRSTPGSCPHQLCGRGGCRWPLCSHFPICEMGPVGQVSLVGRQVSLDPGQTTAMAKGPLLRREGTRLQFQAVRERPRGALRSRSASGWPCSRLLRPRLQGRALPGLCLHVACPFPQGQRAPLAFSPKTRIPTAGGRAGILVPRTWVQVSAP